MTTISEAQVSSPKRITLSKGEESFTFSSRVVSEVAEALAELSGEDLSEDLYRAGLQILIGLPEAEEISEFLSGNRVTLEYPATPRPRIGGPDSRTLEILRGSWEI